MFEGKKKKETDPTSLYALHRSHFLRMTKISSEEARPLRGLHIAYDSIKIQKQEKCRLCCQAKINTSKGGAYLDQAYLDLD